MITQRRVVKYKSFVKSGRLAKIAYSNTHFEKKVGGCIIRQA